MRTIVKTIGATLLIATLSVSAFADNGRWRYDNHRHYSGRSHGGDWVAPLLFLGLAGAVLSASASQPSPPPVTYVESAPVYVPAPVTYYAPAEPVQSAPVPPPAPANTWYFCQSVGKYYPYAQHCPEGWQPVASQR